MIETKTGKEIKVMAAGGKILAKVLRELREFSRVGVALEQIDKLADKLIQESGGKPSFKMVPGYRWATCLCVNDVVVHGIPTGYKLLPGDILGIDAGLFYQGYHTDMATTIIVGDTNGKKRQDLEKKKFLETGKEALMAAVDLAQAGNRVGHLSRAIQKTVEAAGYSVVRTLTGHGIGRNLHENPPVPCFLKGKMEKTPLLVEGLTLAIEVIYNQGGPGVIFTQDGWTVKTRDGQLSGLFEDTVAITTHGPIVLTQE